MSAFGGPNIIDDGLVLYLDAGNRKSYPGSGTTWFDKSGRGNNGTLTNGPTFNTGSLGSIVFDGVDDLVICSASLQNATAFTIGMWLYNTDTNINYAMSQQPLGSDRFSAHNQYSVESGKSFFTVYGVGANDFDNYYNVTPTFTTGSWFYQIYQWDSSHTMKMFLNGVQQSGTYEFLGTRPTSILNSFPFRIGLGARSGVGTLFYFKGNIPITQVYNRVLSAQEILQNYNATKGRFGL
jgi:hypothetical protein